MARVEVGKEFKYLGSLIEVHGGVSGEVSRRIAQASKVFGHLRGSVFLAWDLGSGDYEISLSVCGPWCSFVWC